MAFQVSPGVLVTEKDLTNIIPAVSTSIAGIVVGAEKGPMDEIVAISSEDEYVRIFGKPDSDTFEFFFSATNFLKYGNALRVVRATTSNVNAVTSGTAIQIKNTQHYLDIYSGGAGSVGAWAAREAGDVGNNLKVSMCTNSTAFGPHGMGGNLVAGAVALAATSVTVDDGSLLQVGDLVEFGSTADYTAAPSGHYYKVTAISTHILTIARYNTSTGLTESGGLRTAVVDNAKVRRHWEYYFEFSQTPTTTTDVAAAGGSLDEVHIAVIDEDGGITGTAGTTLEKYEGLSQAGDARDSQGNTNYYADVIYANSNWIYWMDHETTLANAGTAKKGLTFDQQGANDFTVFSNSLASGVKDNTPSSGELSLAYDLFLDTENVEINFLLCGPSQAPSETTGDTKATKLIDIAEQRKDCIAFISPSRADTVPTTGTDTIDPINMTQNIVDFANGLSSSSYAVIDSGYKKQYDKYNDVFRMIPLNGDIAGLCARTDLVSDPWFSPGGFNRGQIRGAVSLAYNPNEAQRDILYKANVNPVVTFPGQGTVLFGDKTFQKKPSAFDRINVRRLFLTLEKAISTAAKFQLFEFNDEFTRAQFRNMVEPFLRDVQGRRGITDFSVICDDSNNTGEVIDRNEFIADIYVKPARSINFIKLNFIATRTGVAFSEVIGA